MNYITYEEPHVEEEFTEKGLLSLYRSEVDKTEYEDYETWKNDMLRSGVFERSEKSG